MEITKTKLEGVVIIEPAVFGDKRGFFMESWSKRAFAEAGLDYDFVQDNHSASTVKGTLRGIHFQRGDKAQAKLKPQGKALCAALHQGGCFGCGGGFAADQLNI